MRLVATAGAIWRWKGRWKGRTAFGIGSRPTLHEPSFSLVQLTGMVEAWVGIVDFAHKAYQSESGYEALLLFPMDSLEARTMEGRQRKDGDKRQRGVEVGVRVEELKLTGRWTSSSGAHWCTTWRYWRSRTAQAEGARVGLRRKRRCKRGLRMGGNTGRQAGLRRRARGCGRAGSSSRCTSMGSGRNRFLFLAPQATPRASLANEGVAPHS